MLAEQTSVFAKTIEKMDDSCSYSYANLLEYSWSSISSYLG